MYQKALFFLAITWAAPSCLFYLLCSNKFLCMLQQSLCALLAPQQQIQCVPRALQAKKVSPHRASLPRTKILILNKLLILKFYLFRIAFIALPGLEISIPLAITAHTKQVRTHEPRGPPTTGRCHSTLLSPLLSLFSLSFSPVEDGSASMICHVPFRLSESRRPRCLPLLDMIFPTRCWFWCLQPGRHPRNICEKNTAFRPFYNIFPSAFSNELFLHLA